MRAVRLGWAVFFLAAGVLGFEIALMRVLLVTGWHHFAFLVISVALLGFGASGTALFVLRPWVERHREAVLFALILATGVSMPLAVGIAQHVPIEARFVPSLMGRQIGCWGVYWLLLGIPFFMGAAGIGLGLMAARERVPSIYAANLLGSAVGAAFATVLMNVLPPAWLSPVMGGLAIIGAAALRPWLPVVRVVAWVACIAVGLSYLALAPPNLRLDPYKYGAYLGRLEEQGSARRVAVAYGPRATLEAYQGDVFHDLPFLSGSVTPPPMTVLVADGHLTGSLLNISKPEDAVVTEQTIMALPYAVAPPRPSVLLLGEAGGANVWLARRHGAASIHVVQPDANLAKLVTSELRGDGGAVFKLPGVQVAATEPRHFVEHGSSRFDLIQLVALESSAAGSGGAGGLGQDHLMTVEGISACLNRLAPEGLLTVARAIQTPPRDNLRLLATFVAALRKDGVAEPEQRIVILRDYLAVCTIVKASPWTPQQIQRIRRLCVERELTPVWFPGVRHDELNHPDAIEGPSGSAGDWYFYGATQLFFGDAGRFIDQWPFDIRPATDDRPFFLDFCKLASITALKRAFGDLWLTRAELAFLFVLAAILVVGVVGAVMVLLPLLLLRRRRTVGGWGPTVVYFTAIGLAYLLLEMTFLSRLTRWIGDPVTAAAITITGFLLLSGLGSLTAQRAHGKPARLIRRLVVALLVVGVVELVFLDRLSGVVGSLPHLARCGAAILAIAPLGYLLGFPMPVALSQLDRSGRSLIPWAWGANGFASVLAAPLATAIGMTWGFSAAGALALILYVVPAVVIAKLPGTETG